MKNYNILRKYYYNIIDMNIDYLISENKNIKMFGHDYKINQQDWKRAIKIINHAYLKINQINQKTNSTQFYIKPKQWWNIEEE